MAGEFDLVFNSGSTENRYTEGDNVSLIEINMSDEQYYQTGIVTTFDTDSIQSIGDEVQILIDDTDQFSGYVARRQQEIRGGKKHVTYQLVGKTYDLWRYHTGANSMHSGYTTQIAYNLISSNCQGISGNDIPLTSGVNLTNEIDFSNTVIGDAIVRLSELDGYKFYVDNDGELQYYKPEVRNYDFSVEENDILDMSPVEEADEDLVNDVLVIGGSDYSVKDEVSITHPSSAIFPSGIWVAQRFLANDTTLKAIKLYLDRTTGDDSPEALNFEVWEDSSKILFEDDFDNSKYILTSSNMDIDNSELILSYAPYQEDLTTGTSTGVKTNWLGSTFHFTRDVTPVKGNFLVHNTLYPDSTGYCLEIRSTGSDGYPDAILTSGSTGTVYGDIFWCEVRFNQQVRLIAGTKYALVIWRNDSPGEILGTEGFKSSDDYPKGSGCYSGNGVNWTWTNDIKFKVKSRVYSTTGQTLSTSYPQACQYIKLDINNVVSSSRIYLSGTNDGGTTWSGLTDNTWMTYGSESAGGAQVKYIFSSNGYWTPKIGLSTFEIGDAAGSSAGIPRSGSKIEWSDDITITDGEIPYAPNWSEWQSYSDPKLSGLSEDNYYWLVMYHNSANSAYWNYYYDPKSTYDGKIAYSWYGPNFKTKWSSNSDLSTVVPSGNMSFQLGWSEGEITATTTNQSSIDNYGRFFKVINDSTINTLEMAQARADAAISGMEIIPRKGTITIDGRTDMETYYRFSSNLTNFDIEDIWDVVSYTQRINQQGFTTDINYGKQPFDIMKHISDLESEVL